MRRYDYKKCGTTYYLFHLDSVSTQYAKEFMIDTKLGCRLPYKGNKPMFDRFEAAVKNHNPFSEKR